MGAWLGAIGAGRPKSQRHTDRSPPEQRSVARFEVCSRSPCPCLESALSTHAQRWVSAFPSGCRCRGLVHQQELFPQWSLLTTSVRPFSSEAARRRVRLRTLGLSMAASGPKWRSTDHLREEITRWPMTGHEVASCSLAARIAPACSEIHGSLTDRNGMSSQLPEYAQTRDVRQRCAMTRPAA